MEKWETKKTSIVLVASMLIMLTLFYAFFNYTFAWLYTTKSTTNTGTSNAGSVTAGLNSSTTGTYSIELGSANSAVNTTSVSTVTNNGTVDALVRVVYTLYVDEDAKEVATTKHLSSVTFNSGFLAGDDNIENTYSGNYYYNAVLGAGKSVSFINNIIPNSTGANKTLKLKLAVEMVGYNGGAYNYGFENPWNDTPGEWFANISLLTKPASSVIGPKLAINWADVGKIEFVGCTTSGSNNILLCTYNGAYIGLNNNAWVFNGLTGSANVAPATFIDGEVHKVTFTITATTSSSDYIGFIWDSSWSQEVGYSSVKIVSKDGTTLANLVSNISGKFYDRVSKAVLPMYTWSSGSASSTTSVYYKSNHVENIDGSFESCEVGATSVSGVNNNQIGSATFEIVDTDAFSGSKCLKVAGEISGNKRIYIYSAVKKGYSYRFSFALKSNIPNGTYYTAKTIDGSTYGALIKFEINGGDYSWKNIYPSTFEGIYSCSGEWEIISLETGVLTSDATIFAFVTFASGYEYYIDDMYIQRI